MTFCHINRGKTIINGDETVEIHNFEISDSLPGEKKKTQFD